jgi:flavin reductase (DIM6/NTAB) family NADH-FMN oxidoreductase RutF
MDARAIGRVFEALDPPVWIITAADGARRSGLVATFVTQASIVADCRRVVIGVARQHYTTELIEKSGAFGLHWLSRAELEWCWRFGIETGRAFAKFEGLAVRLGPGGVPLLTDAPAWLACRVEARFDTGDRTLYLGAVDDGGRNREAEPLRVGTMFAHASSEQKARLDAHYAADAEVDRALIATWRQKSLGVAAVRGST